jgi:hypothetical protein
VRFVPSVLQIPMRLHFANANNSEVVTGKHSKGKLLAVILRYFGLKHAEVTTLFGGVGHSQRMLLWVITCYMVIYHVNVLDFYGKPLTPHVNVNLAIVCAHHSPLFFHTFVFM